VKEVVLQQRLLPDPMSSLVDLTKVLAAATLAEEATTFLVHMVKVATSLKTMAKVIRSLLQHARRQRDC
jgi:hypothetical protein